MKKVNLQNAVTRWKAGFSDTGSIRNRNLDRFATLNIEAVEKKLNLRVRGEERGRNELPPEGEVNLDEVESEIVNLIQRDIEEKSEQYERNQATYAERFHRIDSIREFSGFENDARDAISDFKRDIEDGLSMLQITIEQLQETARERANFRKKHKLDRTAHYPESGGRMLIWGLIAIIFIAETAANGNFLAKVSDYGLLGGWVEAFGISLVNIGFAFLVGYYVARNIWHINLFRKFLGLLAVSSWILFVISFNLLVAHYRETPGIATEIAGFVFNEFLNDPTGINDFKSWMLCFIGILAALFAFIHALKFDDIYPFYGKLDRKYEKLRTSYAKQRTGWISQHSDSKDDVVDLIKAGSVEQGKFGAEQRNILISSENYRREFELYLKSCNEVRNQLLKIYRSANVAARKTKIPKHFDQPMNPETYDFGVSRLPSLESLSDYSSYQTKLDEVISEFYNAFNEAVSAYPSLDKVTGGPNVGESTQA